MLVVSFLLEDERPNFIVIVADDLGYNDLGAFGSPSLNTPVLDRLARDGMKLNQFYSTGWCQFSSHQIDRYFAVLY